MCPRMYLGPRDRGLHQEGSSKMLVIINNTQHHKINQSLQANHVSYEAV